MSGIFTFIEDQISGGMNQIAGQAQQIEDAVKNPLSGIVDQVLGGVWKGNGATRFVNEMKSEVIPALASLFMINMNFMGGIKKSIARMTQANQDATSQANALIDEFTNIF